MRSTAKILNYGCGRSDGKNTNMNDINQSLEINGMRGEGMTPMFLAC